MDTERLIMGVFAVGTVGQDFFFFHLWVKVRAVRGVWVRRGVPRSEEQRDPAVVARLPC